MRGLRGRQRLKKSPLGKAVIFVVGADQYVSARFAQLRISANGEPILRDWGWIADQISVGCMDWMRFEGPVEPESVC